MNVDDLYNAFVEELNKRADAVPSINHELLEEIAKRSDDLMKIIQNFGKEVSSLKANADKILQISRGHGGEVRDALQQIEWHFCYECVI